MFWHPMLAEPLRLKHLETALKFPGGPYEGMVYKTKSWKLVIAPSQRFSIVAMGKTSTDMFDGADIHFQTILKFTRNNDQ